MATELTEAIVTTIRHAARQLRGQAKRAFQARVAIDYLHGSARRAETVFGWGREADEDPACLRISIDSKAKVKIGAFSRGGRWSASWIGFTDLGSD